MLAHEIANGIHWVGVIDWELRDFHGFETPRGGTYNAYLVVADKIALVDTVKTGFVPEMIERIKSVVPLEKIDYIVVNHVEPDHNSGLAETIALIPQAKVVASPAGVKGVAEYHNGLAIDQVTGDDVIDLGGKSLHFLPQPMVHWPDSMFTFCPEDCVLMPNDAFGQHLATSERWSDEVDEAVWMEELKAYYANILMPLENQVGKAIAKVVELGWDCKVIAPSHGVGFRGDDVGKVIDKYLRWSAGESTNRIVVAYSTMWHSTELLARAISDAASVDGVDVYLADLADTPISAITTELMDAKALLLGSSTWHRGMLFRVAAYLQWLAGLKPPNKIAGVFGSFGWSGGATKQMTEKLTEIGFELPYPEFTVKYRPTAEDLKAAEAWGAQFAALLRERDQVAASVGERS